MNDDATLDSHVRRSGDMITIDDGATWLRCSEVVSVAAEGVAVSLRLRGGDRAASIQHFRDHDEALSVADWICAWGLT